MKKCFEIKSIGIDNIIVQEEIIRITLQRFYANEWGALCNFEVTPLDLSLLKEKWIREGMEMVIKSKEKELCECVAKISCETDNPNICMNCGKSIKPKEKEFCDCVNPNTSATIWHYCFTCRKPLKPPEEKGIERIDLIDYCVTDTINAVEKVIIIKKLNEIISVLNEVIRKNK